MSFEIVGQVAESYRKIRNTIRFILGNLYDYNPANPLPYERLLSLDKFMLSRLQRLVSAITDAYEQFQFHRVYHLLLDFCVNWLSAFYLDILKDRLYIYPPNSLERLSAQTTLFQIAQAMITILAPIMPHTSEEAFQYLPNWEGKPESVHLMDWPSIKEELINEELERNWERILNLRRKIYKQIEEERAKGLISNPLEANVEVYLPEEDYKVLKMVDSKLSDILITSSANYHLLSEAPEESKEVEGIKVVITRAKGEKCARCWQVKESVGKDEEYPDLCERCASILRNREIKPC